MTGFVLATAATLQAQVYNVNYVTTGGGPNAGATVTAADFDGLNGYNSATDGAFFNEFTNAAALTENIVDTSGTASNIDFQFSASGGNNLGNDWSQNALSGRSNVFNNYLAPNSGAIAPAFTLTFSELPTTETYQLTILAAGDNAGGHSGTTFEIAGAGSATSIANSSTLGFVEGQNIATISNITTVDGTVVVTITPSTQYPEINGFQLSVVPEPGTYALIAGALALSVVMVRRRK
ncbi:PEP-CTERM sorting domain-containing protein [Coraliomargarita akajimensis]|nr:PEP-CTERM sorting domain-containing protein [Coraliomargarita akajimensis]